MVSTKMLELCHKRLCVAKKLDYTAPPFANTCVLAVGDFYQLPPVCGTPLYHISKVHSVNDLAQVFGHHSSMQSLHKA